jgi:hypothetical protein
MLKFLQVILIVTGVCPVVFGQGDSIDSLRIEYDKSYGLDVLLNNGRKYFPDSNPVTGHPFWISQNSYYADITMKGKTFSSEKIKFNSYKQEFVLFYTNLNNQSDQIVLNSDGIDSVRIGEILFIPSPLPGIKQKFVQQIYQGKLDCYIGWSKELQFNRTGVDIGYIYSKDNQSKYLLCKDVLYRFKSRSSFLDIFSGYKKGLIRKYLASRHQRFKKMNEDELRKLMVYCEKTLF